MSTSDNGSEGIVDLRKFNINLSNPNDVIKVITDLENKINVMRALLWEWNCTSDAVWNYYRLKDVGEREEDYDFIKEDEDCLDLSQPDLFDEHK